MASTAVLSAHLGVDHEVIMVAVCNRADHYIFMLWFVLLLLLSFFFFLA